VAARLLVVFSTLFVAGIKPFSIQLKKLEIAPLPPMRIDIEPLNIKVPRISVAKLTIEGIVSELNLLEMVLNMDFNYQKLVPPAEAFYTQVP